MLNYPVEHIKKTSNMAGGNSIDWGAQRIWWSHVLKTTVTTAAEEMF